MFKFRYDMTEGKLRRGKERIAGIGRGRSAWRDKKRVASSRRRSRSVYGTGGGVGSGLGAPTPYPAGGSSLQRYSPVYERAESPTLAEEFLPTDTATQNKIFRNIIMFDPIAGPATEYWRDLTFSDNLLITGIRDKKLTQFYMDVLESSGIAGKMPDLLSSYLTFGRFVMHMLMDEKRGFWTDVIIHDLDRVHITRVPFPGEAPLIDVEPSDDDRTFASSKDPRAIEIRKKYDPMLVKMMASGKPIPLPPENTMFLARKAYATDYFGTSYLTRILPFWIYEKSLVDATIAGARRRSGPVRYVNVPDDYSAMEMDALVDQFFAAEEDPVGGLVMMREGVTVNELGSGRDQIWKMSDEWDFLSSAKMRALGISETLLCLSGDTYIATKEHGIVQLDALREEGAGAVQDLHITVAGKYGAAKTSNWRYSGKAERTLQVTTQRGYSVRSTPEHRFLVLDDGETVWKRAKEIAEGDLLCINTKEVTREGPLELRLPDHEESVYARRTIMPKKPKVMTPDLAWWIGIIVSEGWYDHSRIIVGNSDVVLNARFIELTDKLFGLEVHDRVNSEEGTELLIKGKQYETTKTCYRMKISSTVLSGWLTYLGLCPSEMVKDKEKTPSWYKEVPWCILQADRESQLAYLAAYIEGDGTVQMKQGGADSNIYSRSIINLKQMQILMSAHGVVSSISKEYYRLHINRVQCQKLFRLLRPYIIRKDIPESPVKGNRRCDGVPARFVVKVLEERLLAKEQHGVWFTDDGGEEVFIRGGCSTVVNTAMKRKRYLYSTYRDGGLDSFLEALFVISKTTYAKLMHLLQELYVYDDVISIEEAGPCDVYDITMDENEDPAFVANGVVVHNSGEANWNSLEMVVSVFLEKVRAMRRHFTQKIVVEKMFMTLARQHGYTKTTEAQLAHRIRIAKKDLTDDDLLIPTVEWDRPIEPVGDEAFVDILDRLSEKGLPIPVRMLAQASGFNLDKALESFEADLETQKKIYQYRLAQIELGREFGFDAEGNYVGEEFEGEVAGEEEEGGLGAFEEEFGVPGGEEGEGFPGGEEGEEEAGPGEEAGEEAPPGAPTGPEEGFGASPDGARFPVEEKPSKIVTGSTDDEDPGTLLTPESGTVEARLDKLPIWDRQGLFFDLPKRKVAKLLYEISTTDPSKRERGRLAKTLPKRWSTEGLTEVQRQTMAYLAMRLGYIPIMKLQPPVYDYLKRWVTERMDQQGLTGAITQELYALSKFSELNSPRKKKIDSPNFMRRFRNAGEARLKSKDILTGVID